MRRAFRDRVDGLRFAHERGPAATFPFEWSRYSRQFIDYPGQEALAAAKRNNQRVLADRLDGVVVRPGEVFSVWRLAPRPTSAAGYAAAAALKDGALTREVGGAVCLLSTVLYNAGLLAGLEVLERHCHSVDSYGSRRYFELGRDAAVEFGYLDLRFRNPFPTSLRLSIDVRDEDVSAGFFGDQAAPFVVSLEVAEPRLLIRNSGGLRFSVAAARKIVWRTGTCFGRCERQLLGDSVHRIPPELEHQWLGS